MINGLLRLHPHVKCQMTIGPKHKLIILCIRHSLPPRCMQFFLIYLFTLEDTKVKIQICKVNLNAQLSYFI